MSRLLFAILPLPLIVLACLPRAPDAPAVATSASRTEERRSRDDLELPDGSDSDATRKKAGVCSRCHVLSVVEWSVSAHVDEGTTCRRCHGPSEAHVANERNEVKPDRIPRGVAIAELCARCHDEGCPSTLRPDGCETCHHPHALVNLQKTETAEDEHLTALYTRWTSFRQKMDDGQRLVDLRKWTAAQEEFRRALELIPGNGEAQAAVERCQRRVEPNLPGFEIVDRESDAAFDRGTGLPLSVSVPQLGLSMVLVPPGAFDIGSEHLPDSTPVHTVRVDAFYLATLEVTQQQWTRWMGSNPSTHKGDEFPDADRRPVESVSWEDCQTLIERLNEFVPGGGFRLPTEAEWEYACSGGAKEALANRAWFRDNTLRRADDEGSFKQIDAFAPRPVGSKQPNIRGLYDMQGNVSEWCSSLDRPYVYDPGDGRESPTAKGMRILRGGSFADSAELLHPSLRHAERTERRYRWNGVRLARSVPAK